MALDSDTFRADMNLAVTFYSNKKETPPVDYIRIEIPGNSTLVHDQAATEHDKVRFANQWQQFELSRGGAGYVPYGVPLEEWNGVAPEQFNASSLEELKALRFQTVEQVAMASDAQVQKIGIGGIGLRSRARDFLASRRNAITVEASQEMADLRKQVADLMAMVKASRDDKPAPAQGGMPGAVNLERRGPGRPRKEDVSVNDDHALADGAGNL